MTLVGALTASRLVAVIGPKRQLILGPVMAASGLLWMSLLSFGDTYWAHMFGPLALFGAGIGLSFVPMTLTATTGVPPKEAGLASGLINTTRQVGGAVGLAVLATLASSTTRAHLAAGHPPQVALTAGYDKAFLVAGMLLVLGAVMASFIRTTPPIPSSSGPAPTAGALPSLTEVHELPDAGVAHVLDSSAADEVLELHLSGKAEVGPVEMGEPSHKVLDS
jgi:MFS family permease